ncbi:MAG: hypothetical protein AAGA86_01470, partial [Bacteroidota bacterium]
MNAPGIVSWLCDIRERVLILALFHTFPDVVLPSFPYQDLLGNTYLWEKQTYDEIQTASFPTF